jgi:hypothetical protein
VAGADGGMSLAAWVTWQVLMAGCSLLAELALDDDNSCHLRQVLITIKKKHSILNTYTSSRYTLQ